MDDMTVTTMSVIEGRWMLEDLEGLFMWAHMTFKPAKCRSLVLKRGKVQDGVRFKIGGKVIPTVAEQPVKSLGKWFDSTLGDRASVKETVKQAEVWMKGIDKSGLPGKYKAWCYQHGDLPRLLWPLLMYEVPITSVEKLERAMSGYLRRWLGVPRSFSSLGLYSSGSKLQLPLSSVVEEYKVCKACQVLLLRDSKDAKVSKAGVEIRTGRKWRAQEAVDAAEASLKLGDVVGTVTYGRMGLGCVTRAMWKKATLQDKRGLVQDEVRKVAEEERQARAAALRKQGRWLNWEGVKARSLNWAEIWKMEAGRLGFLLKSVYDVLPSPTNLVSWKLNEDPACKLCGKPANLEHILSSCQVSLANGRYRWRHDQVLAEIAAGVESERMKKRPGSCKNLIAFVRAGEGGRERERPESLGILGMAGDWQLSVDLKGQLKFPQEILSTTQRPDVVMWSSSTKMVVLLELTVPWEERVEEAYERKMAKYQELVLDCQEKGWKCWCFPVEVGCRGFVAQSLWRALGSLGISGKARRKVVSDAGKRAETASSWIWKKREETWSC